MTIQEEFIEVFKIPPIMHPYVSLIANEKEIALIAEIKDQAVTIEQITEILDISQEEANKLVANAYKRELINREEKDGKTVYTSGTFYKRLDNFAMYEKWGDIPPDVRDEVIAWSLQEWANLFQPKADIIRSNPEASLELHNCDVLLLEEALEMVDAAEEHAVVECDCRSVVMACDHLLEVCIRLDEGARVTLGRGMGRKVSKEECKSIVIDAERNGLMHTGIKNWREHPLFGFCNCCACCCYPIRGSKLLGLEKKFPRSHYVAVRDPEKCKHCGTCVERCHFDACYHDDQETVIDGEVRKTVKFDPTKCWGCGICVSSCPNSAIAMEPLQPIE